MARFPALVNALTQTDGRPRATLDLIGRTIRDGGLLTAGRRGEGASHMTVQDAANFLIGACGVQSPSLAAEAVRQFRSLKQTPHGRRDAGDGPAMVFGLLAACDTFGQAADVLVAEAGNLDNVFAAWTRAAFGAQADHWLLGPSLTVSFSRSVEIVVDYPDHPRQAHYFRFLPDATLLFDRQYTALDDGADRCVTTTIGMRTLCTLHDCIFDLVRDPAAEAERNEPQTEGAGS